MMPDGELPVIALRVHEPLAVIRRSGERDALLFAFGQYQCVCLCSKRPADSIKGDAAEVVAYGGDS